MAASRADGPVSHHDAADEYRPPRWLPGGDLQTVVAAFWPLPDVDGIPERMLVEVAPGNAVLVAVNRPAGTPRGSMLLLHGMGGSADSGYLRVTARAALERGWVVLRMNLRNCGGTERHATTLYNAGQSGDVARVLATLECEPARFPRPYAVAGFSLGGAILLLHAGQAGAGCAADALAAVNPPVDLECCLRALERPRNWPYQRYYARRLLEQIERVARVRPVPGPRPHAVRVRDVRRFDTLYTAPDAGYPSAEAYYRAASAAPLLGDIRRPALVLSAVNDPVVPVEMFASHHGLRGLTFVHSPRGGHCGYPQTRAPRCWAALALLRFFDERLPAG